ncbi:hypothetical protein ACFLS1_09400 [Verrucomicrobiota bacterium]
MKDSRAIDRWMWAGIIITPFLMFYWMLPFFSKLTLGFDYCIFGIHRQMELMFSVKTGSFPLYVPGCAGGLPSCALTLSQMCHPVSYLAAVMPGYWAGKALEWNTFFRLLSLGITHLALFGFLRKLRLSHLICFLLSLITIYNLRMLDLFHYGGSLESWTGYILLCTAIGYYCIEPKRIIHALFIIGATYWLITSDHAQMVYYGLMGAGVFALTAPYFTGLILGRKCNAAGNVFEFWVRTGLCFGIGVALAWVYILPMYLDYLVISPGRTGLSYAWADGYADTFVGTLNNFLQPLRSNAAEAFGGSSLFLVAALVPALRLFRVKIPRVIWAIWLFSFVVFLHMQGERTPVHFLVWRFLPLASYFRVAGRISMVLPPFFMLILVWILRADTVNLRVGPRDIRVSPGNILAVLSLIIVGIYSCVSALHHSGSGVSIIEWIWQRNNRVVPNWLEPLTLFLGAIVLAVLAFPLSHSKLRNRTVFVLCIVTCVHIGGILKYGTWVEQKQNTPAFEQMLEQKRAKLEYSNFSDPVDMFSAPMFRQLTYSWLEPFLGKVYTKYRVAESNEEAYRLMEQGRKPDEIVVEQYDEPPALKAGVLGQEHKSAINSVVLTYSSFNRVVFDVQAVGPGFFGISYPCTGHWKATVDGDEAQIYRANGAYQAIRVPAGDSTVEFRYWSSAAFNGMVVSCLMFVLVGTAASFYFLQRRRAVLTALIVFVSAVGVFGMWYRSLYTGQNIGTVYVWSEDFYGEGLNNLAYGRWTHMSSIESESYPHRFGSGRGVDGDSSPRAGFFTKIQTDPSWLVDLHDLQPIGSVVLHEGLRGSDLNLRPLIIRTSADGKEWQTIKTISQGWTGVPLRVELENEPLARFIMVKASGKCRLTFDEVEIYPPHK